jgi:hypothetical protein
MESPPDKNLNLLNIQEDKKNEEENKEKENINTQIIIKNNSSELTKTKRRNSLDLNTFKINSKNDIANIIPKIYNNISENAIIPKIKNNSMKKLRPKIINEMTIETKKENKKINERNDYIFKSIIKIRKETSRPQLLDEQWYYEKNIA